jgi:hypothetical protein
LAIETLAVPSHCTNSRFFTNCYLETVPFQTGCRLATGTSVKTNRRALTLGPRERPTDDGHAIAIIGFMVGARIAGRASASRFAGTPEMTNRHRKSDSGGRWRHQTVCQLRNKEAPQAGF